MFLVTLLSIYLKIMKIELVLFEKEDFKNILQVKIDINRRWRHHVWPMTSDMTLIFNVYRLNTGHAHVQISNKQMHDFFNDRG